ncbi:hypothetical protein FQR65_LT06493 [Abscondita terminalis]|nr:hypothetical protein FQR65_LT06493 [Abscondita terminalis]
MHACDDKVFWSMRKVQRKDASGKCGTYTDTLQCALKNTYTIATIRFSFCSESEIPTIRIYGQNEVKVSFKNVDLQLSILRSNDPEVEDNSEDEEDSDEDYREKNDHQINNNNNHQMTNQLLCASTSTGKTKKKATGSFVPPNTTFYNWFKFSTIPLWCPPMLLLNAFQHLMGNVVSMPTLISLMVQMVANT